MIGPGAVAVIDLGKEDGGEKDKKEGHRHNSHGGNSGLVRYLYIKYDAGMGDFPPYMTGLLLVLLLTGFVKIFTSLSILRMGLGLSGTGFGIVIAALSFALAMIISPPELQSIGGFGGAIFDSPSLSKLDVEKTFRPFIEKNASPDITARLQKRVSEVRSGGEAAPEKKEESASFGVLTASFLLNELKAAFQIGFIILLPFLVIDLLTVNIMMSLGITQMSHAVVSVPLKLLLFWAVDGWTLIAEKLLGGYI